MLRASIEYQGLDAAGVRAISEGAKVGDAGIRHGAHLVAFAEAAVAGDGAELATARDALREAAGSAALVDAAGVVGNFERMVRIADGTGIPIDSFVAQLSGGIREELGLDDFSTRRVAPGGPLLRVFAPVLRGAALLGFRIAGRRARSSR
jgi:hypothetical protein